MQVIFFYDSEALRAVAEVADSNPHADLLYGDTAKPRSRSGFEIYPRKLLRYYLCGHSICHQAWFVSKRFYDEVQRYETDRVTGADPRFLLRMKLAKKVLSKKVNRVVVVYQGGGVSQSRELIEDSLKWESELKRQLYSKAKYWTFSMIIGIRNVLKRLFYDKVGWRIWRKVQEWKGGGNGE